MFITKEEKSMIYVGCKIHFVMSVIVQIIKFGVKGRKFESVRWVLEDLFVILDGGLGWYKFPKLWKSHTYGICKGKDLTYQQKVMNSCLFLCCPVT